MPRPTKNLPIISTGMVGDTAINIEPSVKRTSARRINFFLPNLSEAAPEKREPTAAPKVAKLTVRER